MAAIKVALPGCEAVTVTVPVPVNDRTLPLLCAVSVIARIEDGRVGMGRN